MTMRYVFVEEVGEGCVVRVEVSGEINEAVIDALSDFIVHQQKILADKLHATWSLAV